MVAKIAVLEEKLERLLQALKQNKEHVPIETLKTFYARPYKALMEEIRATLTDYTKSVVCSGLPICSSDLDEAVEIIDDTIQKSNIMKFISIAAYKSYDLEKVYSLAVTLRILVIKALLPILDRHTFYWLDPDDTEDIVFSYNTVLQCFFIDDAWVMSGYSPGPLAASDNPKGGL